MKKRIIPVLLAVFLLAGSILHPAIPVLAEERGGDPVFRLGAPVQSDGSVPDENEAVDESGFEELLLQDIAADAPEETAEEPTEDALPDTDELYGDVGISSTSSGLYYVDKLTMKELAALNSQIGGYSNRFQQAPNLGKNYRPGILTGNAYAYTERLINYYRANAGLDTITLDDDWNDDAAYGALVMAMAKHFSHTPNKPAYISDEDYERGYHATSTSNISWCWGYEENRILGLAVTGQIADEDKSNISRLGHRRWLLNPDASVMGVGSATDTDNSSYTDIKVFEGYSYHSVSDYDFISWPASGNNLSGRFPVSTPWSVSLNPDMYQAPLQSDVKVTVENLTGGTVWTFSEGSKSGYFHVDHGGYGVNNCIIFRPNYSGLSAFKGVYIVTVSGIKDSYGDETMIRYPVVFETAAGAANAPDFTSAAATTDDLQSEHPYAQEQDLEWIYTYPGTAQGIDVTFSEETVLEEGDKIRISNGKGQLIGEYTQDQLSGATVNITGKTIRIRLISKNGGGYGFSVDSVSVSVPATAVTLDKSSAELIAGETLTLQPSYAPEDATVRPAITWTSSNTGVATVDEEGKITATGKGKATITAKAGTLNAKCQVTVSAALSDLVFSDSRIRLFAGQQDEISYRLMPADGKTRTFLVSSDQPDKLAVQIDDEGVITATALSPVTTCIRITTDGFTKELPAEVRNNVILHDTDAGGAETEVLVPATPGQVISLPEDPVKDGRTFMGWYTLPNGRGDKVTAQTVLTNQFDLYAYYRPVPAASASFRAVIDETCIYTGKALKPAIRVYADDLLLKEKADYTLTYKNNLKAYTYREGDTEFDDSLAPAVIVTGKGKYSGTAKLFFTITPQDLAKAQAGDQWFASNGSPHKKVPSVLFGKTKLVAGRDFSCTFPDETPHAYTDAGSYAVTLTGKGNYTGTKTVFIHIFDAMDLTDLSKAVITKIADRPYTGEGIELTAEQLIVKAKKGGKTEILTPDADYTVSYDSNTEVGTATVTIGGIAGKSRGSKSATFKITGISLAKAIVEGLENRDFNNSLIEQDLTVRLKAGEAPLQKDKDYTVRYTGNFHAGTASVTITGKGGYTGSIKKTFKINKTDIGKDTHMSYIVNGVVYDSTAALLGGNINAVYTAGGTTPAVRVYAFGKRLFEGTDYTVKYTGNTAVTTDAAKKMPAFTITGKGDYAGTVSNVPFTILPSSLNNVVIMIPDKPASSKAGGYLSAPVLYDENGKNLKEGKDYEILSRKAFLPDGSVFYPDKKSVINTPGTVIEVKICGKGAYGGDGTVRRANYLIKERPLERIKVTAIQKEYTGEAVTLDRSDFYLTQNGEEISKVTAGTGKNAVPLAYGTDFEIIEGTYAGNVQMGTASVMIRGIGDYAGTAKVSFRIGGRLLELLKWLTT